MKIDIYCESVPVHSKTTGYGLSRAIIPILNSLEECIGSIFILPMDGWVSSTQYDKKHFKKFKIVSNIITTIARKINKTIPHFSNIVITIASKIVFGRIQTGSSLIFAIIGANYITLIRAAQVAKYQDKELIVYMVDDLIIPLENIQKSKVNEAILSIKATLTNANKIFCITEALCHRVFELYGVESSQLRLPYTEDFSPSKTSVVKNQLIYVGAVNELYTDTIKMVLEELINVNESLIDKIYFRFTIPKYLVEKKLGRLPDYVYCAEIPSRQELLNEIQSSKAALLPYSFSKSNEIMVRTSFPSKTLDYLYTSPRLIVFAPEYSSVRKYFKNIDSVDIAENAEEFRTIVKQLINANRNTSDLREILRQRHSESIFQNSFLSSFSDTR